MKMKLTLTMVLLVSLFFAGCGKDDQGALSADTGSWMLQSWDGSDELSGKVYLQLNKGAFTLYQLLNEADYTSFQGSYTLDAGQIIGVYSDGKPWAEVYKVRGMNTKKMTLEGVESGVISIYVRMPIPDYVTGGQVRAAQRTTETAGSDEPRRLL